MASPEAEDVRVIQTIGHVDHGKTTFVDSLLAANNIISSRMAGKIRYMDSREDEQQRGITMESSAVSLHFKVMEKTADGGSSPRNYVVNLIDTPGHVDFSSEVSTASRLCDGALVLVDVVEGVCTQTIAVLRQAWLDRLRPILVINKFDRLITELRLSPVEAYHHLSQLIEQVNAVMGSFFAGERMEDDLRWREERERRLAERKELTAQEAGSDAASDNTLTDRFEEKDDEDIYFAPDRGNVIFASAIDGWGFRVGKFAQLFAARLGIKETNLRKVLWGDFYLDPKTKRVISYKHLRGRNLKPLFVQFVLDNIWAVYDSIVLNPNSDKVSKIVTTLNLKIPPRDLKSKDARHLLSAVFSQWLSLSTCTIQAVVEVIPPPSSAQRSRIPKMLYPDLHEETVQPKNQLEANLWQCDGGEDAFVVAYVSKMFAVPTKELPEKKPKALTAEEMRRRGREAREARESAAQVEDANSIALHNTISGETTPSPNDPADTVQEETVEETLLGFARLYSGTIQVNSSVHCVLPKYNNSLPPTHAKNTRYVLTAQVRGLYIMMGRELVPVEKVKAGNVFAICGLEGKVWRNATLCARGDTQGATSITDDSPGHLLNLGGVNRQSPPIVRVALESVIPADMPKVVHGLRLLSQSDPCVETFQQQTGEHVILTAGELHLERCLKDLRERFAKVEIQASKPIVPFRETAIRASDLPPPKAGPNVQRGTATASSSHGGVEFKLRAQPLPAEIVDFLQANISLLKKIRRDAEARIPQRSERTQTGFEASVPTELVVREAEDDDLDIPGGTEGDVERRPTVRDHEFWGVLADLFAKAGPEWKGTCDHIWSFGPLKVGPNLLIDRRPGAIVNSIRDRTARSSGSRMLRDFEDSIEAGFQIATFQGPLCGEPVVGMAFDVVDVELMENEGNGVNTGTAQASGSLISAIKEACKVGMLDWSPRLMLAMYTCDIQASTDVLGKVYATVAKRRGRIVAEEMKEGTSFFTVKALLPVVESFGFAEDIRKRTSGAASPQLIFSGYELFDQDPFWVPTTEEELEDLGEKADRENIARVYMNGIRERKGMFVEKKIVEFAEKQRTLKR